MVSTSVKIAKEMIANHWIVAMTFPLMNARNQEGQNSHGIWITSRSGEEHAIRNGIKTL
jgi:hypothetical protein